MAKVKIFGKAYQLDFTYQAQLPLGISLVGEKLLFNSTNYMVKPKNSQILTLAEKNKLDDWLRTLAKKYIVPRTSGLAEKMAVPKTITHVTVREQRSRWGSCSSLGGLNFNYRLVHFEPSVIDYVIIHELAHLTHMNHSRSFWALVAKYDGEYKAHRLALRHLE